MVRSAAGDENWGWGGWFGVQLGCGVGVGRVVRSAAGGEEWG